MSEKPVHSRLRRLVDWINLTGAKKVVDDPLRPAWPLVEPPARRPRAAPHQGDAQIVCVSKRCSIGWSPSLSQYSMMPASDIGEGDRRRKALRKVWKEIQEEVSEIRMESLLPTWVVCRPVFFPVHGEKVLNLQTSVPQAGENGAVTTCALGNMGFILPRP